MNDQETSEAATSTTYADWGALLFALIFPSLMTWVYFIGLAESPGGLQLAASGIGKLIQFGFPVFWVVVMQRQRLSRPRFQRDGLWLGGLFGLAIVATMFVAYRFWLKEAADFAAGTDQVREKVAGMNIDSTAKFAVMGVFYAVVHSLMEEYYWRWFVFAQLRRMTSLGPAIAISSFGFMAHHVIVLSHYFGWGSFLSLFFSIGVAVGGVAWSWLYHRSQSLFGPWLSHALVDAGIFWIGFELVKSAW